jgi:hypothetical protein
MKKIKKDKEEIPYSIIQQEVKFWAELAAPVALNNDTPRCNKFANDRYAKNINTNTNEEN